MKASAYAASTRSKRPTIRGIFVNSHVAAVRKVLGAHGIHELELRMGRSVDFSDWEHVPVAEEVRLLEHALDLLAEEPVPGDRRAFEAGRLHFRNFYTTPWARILFSLFPKNLHYMLMHARTVAERVFRGVRVISEDRGPTEVLVAMENNDYPLDHFRGFLDAWMEEFGLQGTVTGRRVGVDHFEYAVRWGAAS